MVAATYVFFLMFWVYGVVPHQWLDLGRQRARLALRRLPRRPELHEHRCRSSRTSPFNVSKQTVRDIIAVAHLRRVPRACTSPSGPCGRTGATPRRKQKAIEERTSAYGRPLVRKA